LVGKPLVGKPFVGKPLVGKPLVGKPLVGKPLAGKPLVGKLLVASPWLVSLWLQALGWQYPKLASTFFYYWTVCHNADFCQANCHYAECRGTINVLVILVYSKLYRLANHAFDPLENVPQHNFFAMFHSKGLSIFIPLMFVMS
jgi:hypothetical protein